MIAKSNADAKTLLKTPVPRPGQAGDTWKGVNHGHLVNALTHELQGRREGMTVKEASYFLSREGADLTASLVGPKDKSNLRPAIGLMTSNARRKGLRFYVGVVEGSTGTPLVTSTFGGEDQRNRPHWRYTDDFDLNRVCREAVQQWWTELPTAYSTYTLLRTMPPVEEVDGINLFMGMADRPASGGFSAAPWTRVRRAVELWHKAEDMSPWGLVKVYWQAVASEAFPTHQMDMMMDFLALVNHTTRTKETV